MVCSNHDRMVVELNQGCPRGFGFTLLQKMVVDNNVELEIPVNLTDQSIEVEVKTAPYAKLPALIHKVVSATSDTITDGIITDPATGQFVVQFTHEDTVKLPPNDYALIMRLLGNDTSVFHLSGDGNNYSILRICYE